MADNAPAPTNSNCVIEISYSNAQKSVTNQNCANFQYLADSFTINEYGYGVGFTFIPDVNDAQTFYDAVKEGMVEQWTGSGYNDGTKSSNNCNVSWLLLQKEDSQQPALLAQN